MDSEQSFPNDSDGDALRRLQSHGDDLKTPRNIDFAVVFQTRADAERFAEAIDSLGYAFSIYEKTLDDKDPSSAFCWDVIVVNEMAPSYSQIIQFEDLLERIAGPLRGHNDGWGCFSIPPDASGTESPETT